MNILCKNNTSLFYGKPIIIKNTDREKIRLHVWHQDLTPRPGTRIMASISTQAGYTLPRVGKVAYITPPGKKQVLLTTWTNSLWCASAEEHQTAKEYYKMGRTKTRKHLFMSSNSSRNREKKVDFINSFCKIRVKNVNIISFFVTLWAAETKQNKF